MQPTEREPNNFCQVPGQKCYMNYCDENGCQDRKRRYTALGMSRLNNADLLAQLLKNQEDKEQVELAVAEITERLATAHPTAPAATAEAWVSVLERLPEPGVWLTAVATDNGPEVHSLELDGNGEWLHEGEPTYYLSYYFSPTHWQPLPTPPTK